MGAGGNRKFANGCGDAGCGDAGAVDLGTGGAPWILSAGPADGNGWQTGTDDIARVRVWAGGGLGKEGE